MTRFLTFLNLPNFTWNCFVHKQNCRIDMAIWRDFSHFWIHDNLTIFYKKSADEQVDFGKSKKGAKIQMFETFWRHFSNTVMSVWVLKPIKRNWDRFHRLNCKMAITFKASNSHHHIRFTTLKLIFLLDSLTAQFTFKNALFNGPFLGALETLNFCF